MSSQNNDQSSNAGATPVRVAATTPVHITTATTTAVKASPGTLGKLVVNTGGAGSIATIYNSLAGSGAVIAIVDTATRVSLDFNMAMSIGITVVTSGGVAADITISYL